MEGLRIREKLEIIRDLQGRYNIAIGGSIGLLLHGFDLGRDLSDSDIDIVSSNQSILDYNPNQSCTNTGELNKKESNDMHGSLVLKTETIELKIDIRLEAPLFGWVKKEYNGFEYNVALVHDILRWKELYANKGILKHKQDLSTIHKQLIVK